MQGLGGILESRFKKGLGRRAAVLFMSREGWAACSSGCISSVSSNPMSPLLCIIGLSSRPVALKQAGASGCRPINTHPKKKIGTRLEVGEGITINLLP